MNLSMEEMLYKFFYIKFRKINIIYFAIFSKFLQKNIC
ncbi:hypothetical protein [Inovirus D_HF34_8]|nr:hypothetical protein [Inovirus D_HF34_8]